MERASKRDGGSRRERERGVRVERGGVTRARDGREMDMVVSFVMEDE